MLEPSGRSNFVSGHSENLNKTLILKEVWTKLGVVYGYALFGYLVAVHVLVYGHSGYHGALYVAHNNGA